MTSVKCGRVGESDVKRVEYLHFIIVTQIGLIVYFPIEVVILIRLVPQWAGASFCDGSTRQSPPYHSGRTIHPPQLNEEAFI